MVPAITVINDWAHGIVRSWVASNLTVPSFKNEQEGQVEICTFIGLGLHKATNLVVVAIAERGGEVSYWVTARHQPVHIR